MMHPVKWVVFVRDNRNNTILQLQVYTDEGDKNYVRCPVCEDFVLIGEGYNMHLKQHNLEAITLMGGGNDDSADTTH